MGKIYTDKDVFTAAMERYETIFNEFDNVYFSFSGGKDSSVMIQLAAEIARKLNKKFDILYIDLEAQYQETIRHVKELRDALSDVTRNFYWVCLPLSLRNASSIIQPKWVCWNKEDQKKWVRDMPKHVINENNCKWKWFEQGIEFEQFIVDFAAWYGREHGRSAAGIGIRTDESLNRFRTIVSAKKETYNGLGWTTKVQDAENIYNVYPIYDWSVEDIWGSVSKLDLKYNYTYELMYKNGLALHEQRLCQPYGDDQRNGIDQFRYIEPETWEKVLNRVHGVNFANIYARSSLLGNIKSEKPKDMTWEQYTVFLLETLGLYAPELRDHYYNKIKTFIDWHLSNEDIKKIPDVADRKMESAKKDASWRRIARALEKNDFWMTRLSFSQTKRDVKRLHELKEKYANIIYAKDTDQKHLKNIALELEEMSSE